MKKWMALLYIAIGSIRYEMTDSLAIAAVWFVLALWLIIVWAVEELKTDEN